jgi:hypothetical protein
MKRIPLAALAALLALPHPARAQSAPPARSAQDGPLRLRLTASATGGAFDGEGVLRESGGAAVTAASAEAEVVGERWRLSVPARLAHRETFGVELSETSGALDVEPWYVVSKGLRLGLEAGLSGASRPDWPDPYQRDEATGALRPTDRYSYLAYRGGVQLYARPGARQHLRARYRHVEYDYAEDPAFSEDDLMHLTPRDRSEEQLDFSWRYLQKTWDVALRADYARRSYDTLRARNRHSGATPEDALGNELNPLQELNVFAPSAELGLRGLGGALEVDLRYGLDFQDDPFQGYYSYTAQHPRVAAALALGERAAVKVAYEGWYKTYTADGSTRLDSGTRRTDSRTELSGRLEVRLGGRLSAVGETSYTVRTTNYTDLVQLTPGASGRTYDIDYDYTNFSVLAGLKYEL